MNDWPYTFPLLRVSYGVYKDNFTLTLHETITSNKFSNPNSQVDGIFYENLLPQVLDSCFVLLSETISGWSEENRNPDQ